MENIQMVCIGCPMGCRMTLEKDDASPSGYKVLGNVCKRGETYAIKEMTEPTRMLTSTVVVTGGLLPRLPVRTDKPIPKDKIKECMALINSISIKTPVKMGDIIVDDILETGVKLIASRSMG